MAKGQNNDQVLGRGRPSADRGLPGEIGVGPLGQGPRWTAAKNREVAELDTAMQPIGVLTKENELLWVRVR